MTDTHSEMEEGTVGEHKQNETNTNIVLESNVEVIDHNSELDEKINVKLV